MGKMNRKERRSQDVYKLTGLFRPEGTTLPLGESDLEEAPSHKVLGKIEDVLFVSVPPDTSYNACQRLHDTISVSLGDRKPIMIVSHNVELLRAVKLPKSESANLIRRIQKNTEPEAEVTDASEGGDRD